MKVLAACCAKKNPPAILPASGLFKSQKKPPAGIPSGKWVGQIMVSSWLNI
jgi:hypothetical protein